ncbi:MAG TPA: hypothetical protein VGO47_02375 [Chlamydiales bacterium]|nr:hypothetical protein [Chlamydiales bacterium]
MHIQNDFTFTFNCFLQAKYKERYEDEITIVLTIAPESKPDVTLTPATMLEHAMLWNAPRAFHEQPRVQALMTKFREDLANELLFYQCHFPVRAGFPSNKYVRNLLV